MIRKHSTTAEIWVTRILICVIKLNCSPMIYRLHQNLCTISSGCGFMFLSTRLLSGRFLFNFALCVNEINFVQLCLAVVFIANAKMQ